MKFVRKFTGKILQIEGIWLQSFLFPLAKCLLDITRWFYQKITDGNLQPFSQKKQ